MEHDSFTFAPNYLSKRNRKYAIRRALYWIALAIGLIAFTVWGWNLPEV